MKKLRLLFVVVLLLTTSVMSFAEYFAIDNLQKILEKYRGQIGVSSIKVLIDEGNINTKDKDDWTSLMFASRWGYTEIAQELINIKADVNAKDKLGNTSLMLAAQNKHTEVVKLLINSKANVNAKNNKGDSALSLASRFGGSEIVSILKKAGAK